MDEMGESADFRADDGQAGGDGFNQHIARAFLAGGMDHEIRRLQQIRHVASRAKKREVLVNSIFGD